MGTENVSKSIKFPDNQKYLKVLKRGDKSILASYSGYSSATVGAMLYGYRAITDKLKKAMIQLLEERKQLNEGLNSVIEEVKE